MNSPLLSFAGMALVLAGSGCSGAPEGTVISGVVELTRSTDSDTGTTGFLFPKDTRLDAGPFSGRCEMERREGASELRLDIEHVTPDPFGMSSFSIVTPIATTVDPTAASLAVTVGDTEYSDPSATCSIQFGGFSDAAGWAELEIECPTLAAAENPDPEVTAALNVRLSLDACSVKESS